VRASVQDLVRIIENSLVDRPVLDQTGLTGLYDFHLNYTPSTNRNLRTPEAEDSSVFTAVEKLGLRLEARKAPTETLVVDNAQEPSVN
jgi:uncharacterized protein (TIGR03435 family)